MCKLCVFVSVIENTLYLLLCREIYERFLNEPERLLDVLSSGQDYLTFHYLAAILQLRSL